MDRDQRSRVLFIAGAGWSGTTLLEQALAQVDGYFTIGELYWLWKPYWPSMTCECGKEFATCPFWTAVVDEAYGVHAAAVRDRVERLGRGFDEHIMVSTLRGTARVRPSAALRDLALLVEPIYRAIFAVSGASVVVDASKYALWGFTAQATQNLDLNVVQMVRDPRAFLVSAARAHPLPYPPGEWEPGRTALRSIVTWMLMSIQAEHLTRRTPSTLLLYRDFVHDPDAAMDRIAALTGVDVMPSPFEDGALVVSRLGHAIGGHYTRPGLGTTPMVYDDDRRVANAPAAIRNAALLAMPWWERFQRNAEQSALPHRVPAMVSAS